MLESCNTYIISQWIEDAIDLIYTGDGPPADNAIHGDNNFVRSLGASSGACMVTAVIAQWLVRYMCKKLVQLMTPEAVILKRKYVIIMHLCGYVSN